MSDEGKRCRDCAWFRKQTSVEGQCVRHAPRPRSRPGVVFWPRVGPFEWCGEWSAIHPGVPESREGSPDER